MVCRAFIGEPNKGYQPNHKNGIKADNCVGNLEWVTIQENIKHRRDVLGISYKGEKNPSSILTEKDVIEVKVLRANGWTCKRIASKYFVCDATISHIVNGRTWKHVD